jgi:signal peptidase I
MNKDLRYGDLYQSRFGYRDEKDNGGFFIFLAIVILGILLFRAYWTNNFGGVVVEGRSMNETLYSGEKLLMEYADDNTEFSHGDVIVVYVGGYEECSSISGGYLIKRLIALEGDKLYCTDGQIYICYKDTEQYVPLDEPYAYYTNRDGYDFKEYVVGEGEIFFLGDNRNNSRDSRYQEENGSHIKGLYKEADIYGVVPQWAIDNHSIFEKIFFKETKFLKK